MRMSLSARVAAFSVVLTVAAGCATPPGSASTTPSPSAPTAATLLWPAPDDPLDRTVAAGLKPAPKEYLVNPSTPT